MTATPLLNLQSRTDLARYSRRQKLEALQLHEERERRQAQRLFREIFPDEDTIWRGPTLMGGLIEPGQTLHSRHKYEKHMEFFEASKGWREVCFMAANRVGKALRNGTPVATPLGWRPIESLRTGDEVVAGDGSITTVTGVYPQGVKPLYRLTFDVGETIDCCAEHLWLYQHPRARYPYRQSHGKRESNPFHGEWCVSDTATILNAVGPSPGPRMRVVMPTSQPWQLPAKPIPIDPYLLGLLLGDGMLKHKMIGFATADAEIVEAVSAVLPNGCELHHIKGCDYRIRATKRLRCEGSGRFVANHPLIAALTGLGAYGAGADSKKVPKEYLLNDPATRIALLQGLMDADGSIGKGGAMAFSSVSPQLAQDVLFLVQSLGGKATIEQRQTHYTHLDERRAGQPSYRVRIRLNLCPFRLRRKAERWNTRHNTSNRVLHRIEPTESGHATCISVAHPDRTFVTAHGIVTHNTFSGGGYALACHLTGDYPEWWPGRRFKGPISSWAAGDTYETTRDILQLTLLGEVTYRGGRKIMDGRGIIPGDRILDPVWRSGVQNLVDTIGIRHVTGGTSWLGLKSYDQGRKAFQGTGRHVILVDEEPPMDVYGEMLIRTATLDGLVMLTFTPLRGLSEVVLSFLPADQRPDLVEDDELSGDVL